MADDKVKRKSDAITVSMQRAGIGLAFHARKLSEFGDAGNAILRDMEDSDYAARVMTGKGYSLECKTHQTFDCAYVLAKAMRLSKIDVRVAGLLDLNKYLQASRDTDWQYTRFDNFDEAEALVIPRFYEATFQPLTPREAQTIEYYLTQRMQDGFSVSVQYQGDLRQQQIWTPYFVQALEAKNERVML